MKRNLLIRSLGAIVAAALSALVGAQTVSSFSTNHLPVSVHLPRGTAGQISPATVAAKASALAAARQGSLSISTQKLSARLDFRG